MCRDEFFDPIPTFWHVLLILTVPAAALFGMRAMGEPTRRTHLLGILVGVAACTTLLYVPPFLVLAPLSIMFMFVGIGFLSLAPLVAAASMLSMVAVFEGRFLGLGERRLPGIWTGFFGCMVLLGLIDVRAVWTVLKVREQWANQNDSAVTEWLREHGERAVLEELAGGKPSVRPLVFLMRAGNEFDPDFVRAHWREFTGQAP